MIPFSKGSVGVIKFMGLLGLSLSLAACAAAPEVSYDDTIAVEGTKPVETASVTNESQKMLSEEKAPIIMWQKKPSTSIYNAEGNVVGRLPLIASVTIFETKDGFARITESHDQWAKLSDLTTEKPERLLRRPTETNGMDRIDRDALKEALETGVRPGEQK